MSANVTFDLISSMLCTHKALEYVKYCNLKLVSPLRIVLSLRIVSKLDFDTVFWLTSWIAFIEFLNHFRSGHCLRAGITSVAGVLIKYNWNSSLSIHRPHGESGRVCRYFIIDRDVNII
jgi:hypothetical protein